MIGWMHRRYARVLVAAGLSLLLALALSPVGAGAAGSPTGARPAAAAGVGCDYNRSCTGKDPQAMGCSADAYTIDNVTPVGGGSNVELRSSPACFAAWARDLNDNFGFSIQGSTTNGGQPIVTFGSAGPWTLAVSFKLWTRACARPAGYPMDQSTWTCTNWH
jgi:hypothetical protein